MPNLTITVNLGSISTGLALSAKVFTGSTLSATDAMTETPVASGRYLGTFVSPATTASYDGVIQDASGISYSSFSFSTDSAGNQIQPSSVATLTVQQAAAISGADIGSPGQLTIYRATTAVQAVTSVGSLTGRTKLWLTVKSTATYQNDASDADSILQLTESGGLLILNGSSYGTPSDGSLVVTNDSNATVTLTLKPAATMLLLPGNYRYDIKADFSGVITEMAQGDFVIKATVTLAAS